MSKRRRDKSAEEAEILALLIEMLERDPTTAGAKFEELRREVLRLRKIVSRTVD